MRVKSRGQEAAEALRHQLDLGHGPVDVFDAIRRLGFELYRGPFRHDQEEGALRQEQGVRFVFVNSAPAITRSRFTAAHELGHAMLEPFEDGAQLVESDVESRNGNNDEREANRFAAHFLMDEVGVRELVGGIADEVQRVATTASVFAVSPKTAAIHLCDLALITRAAKDDLCTQLDQGKVKPKALLARFELEMAPTVAVPPEARVDPGHIARAIEVYAEGGFTLVGLADAIGLTPDESIRLLTEAGVEVREEPEDPVATIAQ